MATNTFHFSTSYPKEVEKAKRENWPIFIPVGTIEYHSSICPYGCDALVAQGVAEKIGEKIDCMILPTIYYGVSSYAVGGPQTNTINMDVDIFEGYIYNILKSLLKSGFRNINILVFHQTEDILPTAAACIKAGKKLTFEFLEETKGYGWWGDNKNKEFYENLSAEDNPWNWIRVFNDAPKRLGLKGDHAGIYECSNLEYLYPGSIKLDRYEEADDWFAETSKDMSADIGEEYITKTVDTIIETIQKGLSSF
ncbi:MAG: creatininase family protein [Clostridia bacterium]|nr:creatininase family protein [Clostridia bacterium]